MGISGNDIIRIGGWGDLYYGLLKFNLDNLPPLVDKVEIHLYPMVQGEQYTSMSLDRVTSNWIEDSVTWNTKPSYIYLKTIPAPVTGTWYIIDITSIYHNWKNGTFTNYGIQLRPDNN
ncbi:hypothetical protein CCP3SC5AM1_2480001 [Gammaproteobacteria bacterium]